MSPSRLRPERRPSLAPHRSRRPVRPIRRIPQGFDPFLRVMPAFIHSRTALGGLVPILLTGKVASPERPGAALQRPNGVDAGDAAAQRDLTALGGSFFEKNAVVVALRAELLLQTDPLADLAAILFERFIAREAQVLGEPGNFLVAHPDEPRHAGAAVAAAGAGEGEAVGIPRGLGGDDVKFHLSMEVVLPDHCRVNNAMLVPPVATASPPAAARPRSTRPGPVRPRDSSQSRRCKARPAASPEAAKPGSRSKPCARCCSSQSPFAGPSRNDLFIWMRLS